MLERFAVTPCILSRESDGGPEWALFIATITLSRKNTWCNRKPLSHNIFFHLFFYWIVNTHLNLNVNFLCSVATY